jgi:DNA-binding NtrC family response regulator
MISESVRKRVVVLDDDVDLCELLQLLFEATLGVECMVAHSFAELTALRGDVLECELAILDVNLGPRVASGLDALAWLQANHFHGAIVFLTGHARRDSVLHDHAASAGVPVLEKPVDPDTLLALLSRPSGNRASASMVP